ncbi:MAG: S41 family peptidase [Cytophagales bacterium]
MKKIALIFFAILLIMACTKDEPKPITAANASQTDYSISPPKYNDTLERQYKSFNQCVYNLMKTYYYWNDKVPKIDYNLGKYQADPNLLLDDLKYTTFDKYSFIADKYTSDQLFEEGKETGKGFNLAFFDDVTIMINFVYPGSPADVAGLYRGMIVKKVNGSDLVSAANNGTAGDLLSATTNTLQVIDSNAILKNISVTDASFALKTVSLKKIIDQDGVKIGYLVFNSFLGPSENELNDAFAYFNQNNVTELVLDLRYNGGGYIYIANQLAAQIAGDKAKGNVFMNIIYNNDLKQYNEPYFFTTVTSSLNISRVCILATRNSASSSELVINCLKPYMDVKQFGGITYGKPVGFSGFGYGDKEIYAVQFSSTNANNEGEYFTGIVPNQYSTDQFKYQLGDVREDMLADALYYIKNGSYNTSTVRLQASTSKYFELKGLKSISGTY